MTYIPALDLDALVAIDVHTHVEADGNHHCSLDQELLDASAKYFKPGVNRTPTVGDLASYYRERNMAAVIFTVDARTALGHPSEAIAAEAAEAVARIGVLARDYGVRGMKSHPSLQDFEPNDRKYYPICDACAEHGLVALFDTDQTGIGAGLPGGRGIKLRYSDPMLLDDIAADFPYLTLVFAHPSVPWVDSSLSIAT